MLSFKKLPDNSKRKEELLFTKLTPISEHSYLNEYTLVKQ